MNDEFPIGMLTGVIMTVVVTIFFLWFVTVSKDFSHDVGAGNTVCMTIQDQWIDGTHVVGTKCVTGQQIIEWMRAGK